MPTPEQMNTWLSESLKAEREYTKQLVATGYETLNAKLLDELEAALKSLGDELDEVKRELAAVKTRSWLSKVFKD